MTDQTEWTPDQPLKAGASKREVGNRYLTVALEVGDIGAAEVVARELAAAEVAAYRERVLAGIPKPPVLHSEHSVALAAYYVRIWDALTDIPLTTQEAP